MRMRHLCQFEHLTVEGRCVANKRGHHFVRWKVENYKNFIAKFIRSIVCPIKNLADEMCL